MFSLFRVVRWLSGIFFALMALGTMLGARPRDIPLIIVAILLTLLSVPPLSRLVTKWSGGRVTTSLKRWSCVPLVVVFFTLLDAKQRGDEREAQERGFKTVEDFQDARLAGISDPQKYSSFLREKEEKEKQEAEKQEQRDAERERVRQQSRDEEDRKAQLKKQREIETADYSTQAYIQCKKFVKEKLKAPASADFPFLDFETSRLPSHVYEVRSYVDAQNSFGATIRSNWSCKVQFWGTNVYILDEWRLLDLEIS